MLRVLLCTAALGAAVVTPTAAHAEIPDPYRICATAWVNTQAIDVPVGRCVPTDYGTICVVWSQGNEDPVTVGVGICVPAPVSL